MLLIALGVHGNSQRRSSALAAVIKCGEGMARSRATVSMSKGLRAAELRAGLGETLFAIAVAVNRDAGQVV